MATSLSLQQHALVMELMAGDAGHWQSELGSAMEQLIELEASGSLDREDRARVTEIKGQIARAMVSGEIDDLPETAKRLYYLAKRY